MPVIQAAFDVLPDRLLQQPPERVAEEIIRTLQHQRDEAADRVRELDSLIAAWRRYDPNALPDTKPTLRSALEAVLTALGESSTDAIVDALESRGWMPTGPKGRQKVTDKLSELAKPGGPFERVRYGVYRLATDDDSPEESSQDAPNLEEGQLVTSGTFSEAENGATVPSR